MTGVTLYIIILIFTGALGILDLESFAEDVGGIVVYLGMCLTQVIGAFFIGKLLIDYRNALTAKARETLLNAVGT